MKNDDTIITVNGPVIEGHMLQPQQTGVIYSVSLSNGMVVTSPEEFEALTDALAHKPHSRHSTSQD